VKHRNFIDVRWLTELLNNHAALCQKFIRLVRVQRGQHWMILSADRRCHMTNLYRLTALANKSVACVNTMLIVPCWCSGCVTCLSLSVDGSTLASGSTDATVRLWNTQSQQCIKVIHHAGL